MKTASSYHRLKREVSYRTPGILHSIRGDRYCGFGVNHITFNTTIIQDLCSWIVESSMPVGSYPKPTVMINNFVASSLSLDRTFRYCKNDPGTQHIYTLRT